MAGKLQEDVFKQRYSFLYDETLQTERSDLKKRLHVSFQNNDPCLLWRIAPNLLLRSVLYCIMVISIQDSSCLEDFPIGPVIQEVIAEDHRRERRVMKQMFLICSVWRCLIDSALMIEWDCNLRVSAPETRAKYNSHWLGQVLCYILHHMNERLSMSLVIPMTYCYHAEIQECSPEASIEGRLDKSTAAA